jgi:quercetin dioxygenase-like cupin family protein
MEYIEDLSELIAVAPSSTVSRTVMKGEGVRIVLFSFDQNEELSEHTAAMPILVSVLDGAVEFEAEGRTEILRSGGLLSLGARIPHRVLALEPTRMILAMLDPRTQRSE